MQARQQFTTKTAISVECKVRKDTLDGWLACADAPQKKNGGWDREEMFAFIAAKKKNAIAHQTGANAPLKERKLLLECNILEERLQAERRENEVAAGKLVSAEEASALVVKWGAEMAVRVRVWRESETAKHPDIATEIGRIADGLVEMMRDGVRFG